MKQIKKMNVSRWFTVVAVVLSGVGLLPQVAFADGKQPVKTGIMTWCDTCHAFVQKPFKGDVATYDKKLPAETAPVNTDQTATQGNN